VQWLRNDVATFMQETGGSFLRFPGGNNLEGNSVDTRWKWNETIGPQETRPEHQGTWGYTNTDALGFMEYMQWTEDMGLANVLAVWAGHALDGISYAGSALQPYITDMLNELEFLLGSTSTTYGVLRSKYGRFEPYTVTMIEVGNEDNLSNGCSTYASRSTDIYNPIHGVYPGMTVIASTTDLRRPIYEFDNKPRNKPIFVGKYGSTTGNDGSQTYWTCLQGSCAEAVYMIGLERNSDIVKNGLLRAAASISQSGAPTSSVWTPTQVPSPAPVATMSSRCSRKNRGSTIRPVTSDSAYRPVYWVASNTDDAHYYVKMANYGTARKSVTIMLPDASVSSASLQMLGGGAMQSNFPLKVTITTQTSSVSVGASGGYTVSLPSYAVVVLILGP
ncbi:MAG: hypothetical protein LQ340_002802, partial [Diploschistes diacapsis]